MMIFCLLALLIILLTPSEKTLSLWINSKERVRSKDLVHKGEELFLWLDSFGPSEIGIHLEERAQRPSGYKYFPELIDDIWLRVRQKGGPLSQIFATLKHALRLDLKRTQREKQLIQTAYFQAAGMYLFIWLYLMAFVFILGVSFGSSFYGGLILSQWVGFMIFRALLGSLRKKHFRPLEFLCQEVIALYMVRFQGALSLAQLKAPSFRLKGRDSAFYERMQKVLTLWKKQGQCQESHVQYLQDDLHHLSCDKEQLFLGQLKTLSFCWALLFILPCLFGVSIFGLYALLDV